MFVELFAALALTAGEASGDRICDPSKYENRIEPDMQYTEESFSYENFRWAIDWLREAEWKKRVEGKAYAQPFELGWEFELAYFNRLTKIEGYALKLRVLTATGQERDAAVDAFCTFLINAVPLD